MNEPNNQIESGETPEIPSAAADAVSSRRRWLSFTLRGLLAATALAGYGVDKYRKWGIDGPQKRWQRFVENSDEPPVDSVACNALLEFHDALNKSGLSMSEVISSTEYNAVVSRMADAIVEKIGNAESAVEMEVLLRKYALIREHSRLPASDRERLRSDLVRAVKKRYPYVLEKQLANGRVTVLDFDTLSRILHYAGMSLDDACRDADEVRQQALAAIRADFARIEADPGMSVRDVEIASLVEETMAVDVKPLMPADKWKSLGKRELKSMADSHVHMYNMVGPNYDGYEIERFLAINRTAAFAGVPSDDPDYRYAIGETETQMGNFGMTDIVKRKLRNGESY